MDQQSELAHGSGELADDLCPTCQYKVCRCQETVFTGRYDNEPMLQKWLRKAFELRMACQAQQHKLGELTLNLSTNIMECSNCGERFDLNELVSPELRVNRWVA